MGKSTLAKPMVRLAFELSAFVQGQARGRHARNILSQARRFNTQPPERPTRSPCGQVFRRTANRLKPQVTRERGCLCLRCCTVSLA